MSTNPHIETFEFGALLLKELLSMMKRSQVQDYKMDLVEFDNGFGEMYGYMPI